MKLTIERKNSRTSPKRRPLLLANTSRAEVLSSEWRYQYRQFFIYATTKPRHGGSAEGWTARPLRADPHGSRDQISMVDDRYWFQKLQNRHRQHTGKCLNIRESGERRWGAAHRVCIYRPCEGITLMACLSLVSNFTLV